MSGPGVVTFYFPETFSFYVFLTDGMFLTLSFLCCPYHFRSAVVDENV